MSDPFDPAVLVVGREVLIHAQGDQNVIGVVASVDEGAQSVTFADGRVYQFPPAEEVES